MLKAGDVVGRWAVVEQVASAIRRVNDQGVRARYAVKCVCGVRTVAWYEDLASGRSHGCKSPKCSARAQAVAELNSFLDAIARDHEGTLALVHRLRESLAGYCAFQREADQQAHMDANPQLAVLEAVR